MPASVESICADFARFCEAARDAGEPETVRLWDELYEGRHRDVFDVYYTNWGARSQLSGALERFPEVAEAIPDIERRLRRALPAVEDRVASQFGIPELAGNYLLMVGFFSSDSWVTHFRGRTTNFYALEMLSGSDEEMLLAHELAHLAHDRVLHPSWRVDEGEFPVLEGLYSEGVATVATRALAVTASDSEILWLGQGPPDGWFEAMRENWEELWIELAGSLDGSDRYREFFLGTDADRFPPRAGYLAADALAGEIVARTGLRSWARASKEDVREELRALLAEPPKPRGDA